MDATKVYYTINHKLREGCHEAFMEIYNKNNRLMYNYIRKYVSDSNTIDDIIHNSFLNLWNAKERISVYHKVENYLFRITRNEIYKYYRERLRKLSIEEEIQKSKTESYVVEGEDCLANLEYEKIYRLAIMQLPPQRQKIFKLSREEGLSYQEIAERLDISPNTVKEHMSLAMKTIRTYLVKEHDIALGIIILSLLAF